MLGLILLIIFTLVLVALLIALGVVASISTGVLILVGIIFVGLSLIKILIKLIELLF